ncbi:unnamed protein product, partial [marine sediment metagenome]
MYNIGLREVGEVGWKIVHPDTDGLTIEKNVNGEIFLTGSLTFINNGDWSYLYTKKLAGVIQLEVESNNYPGQPSGLLSIAGEWDYRVMKCTLKVDNNSIYVPFRNILDTEQTPTANNRLFDYDSYVDYKYCSPSKVATVYPNYAV